LLLQGQIHPKCHPCKEFAYGPLLDGFSFKAVGTRTGLKLRPTTERERLYNLVLTLRREGLSYSQIIRKIEVEHGITLRKSHLSGWINAKHKPFGSVRPFDATPQPELAYVIGVIMGDASMSVNRHQNYMIKLRVTDKEFAEEFSRCLSVILGRDPPKVKWHEKTHAWHTQLSSLLLQGFLRHSILELEPTTRHCEDCKGAFLRGFFDSEGSVSESGLTVSNGDFEKLALVSKVLLSLGIESTGPHLIREGGGLVVIKGKFYRRNKNAYYRCIRKKSWSLFEQAIGFEINRKAVKLDWLLRRLKQIG
jgi:intein-encoded DNA endonuclease-like protein